MAGYEGSIQRFVEAELQRDQVIGLTNQVIAFQGAVQQHVRRDQLAVHEWTDPHLVQTDDLRLKVGSHVTAQVPDWLPVYLAQHSAVVVSVPGVSYEFEVVAPEVQITQRFPVQFTEYCESSPLIRRCIQYDSVHTVNSIDRPLNNLRFSPVRVTTIKTGDKDHREQSDGTLMTWTNVDC